MFKDISDIYRYKAAPNGFYFSQLDKSLTTYTGFGDPHFVRRPAMLINIS